MSTSPTPSRRFDSVSVGDVLPELMVDLTPSFVISTALASRDFEDVHHDRDVARSRGLDDVFLNILTTNGLCQRLVTDWAGPDARVLRASVRLGVPAIAGSKLRLSGAVSRVEPSDGGAEGRVEVDVRAEIESGTHATATVVITLPAEDGI